ncbi:MAG: GNAT family N-acetyltransferase [Rhodospirillales bacterium]|jgi:ribosomal protein S18 acetylase RimI-like enzyme|nr:GNAT family N-acetyltransferase [Rhodospirillales bacterium]
MIEIVDAAKSDIEAMADLLLSLFDQEADFKPDRARQMKGLQLILDNPHSGKLFVAHDQDQAVGMVSLLFTISTALGQPVCWLEDMVVRSDRRGLGLGSKLLTHAANFAQARGYGRITLLTDKSNQEAQKFYARHGFAFSEMTPMRRVF